MLVATPTILITISIIISLLFTYFLFSVERIEVKVITLSVVTYLVLILKFTLRGRIWII